MTMTMERRYDEDLISYLETADRAINALNIARGSLAKHGFHRCGNGKIGCRTCELVIDVSERRVCTLCLQLLHRATSPHCSFSIATPFEDYRPQIAERMRESAAQFRANQPRNTGVEAGYKMHVVQLATEGLKVLSEIGRGKKKKCKESNECSYCQECSYYQDVHKDSLKAVHEKGSCKKKICSESRECSHCQKVHNTSAVQSFPTECKQSSKRKHAVKSHDGDADVYTVPVQVSAEVTTVATVEDDLTVIPNIVSETNSESHDSPTPTKTKKFKENEDDGEDHLSDVREILRGDHCELALSLQTFNMGYLSAHYLDGFLKVDYIDVLNRLQTFAGKGFRSLSTTATELAHAGFISLKAKMPDHIACIWCGLSLWNFQEHVNATAIHQALGQNSCTFLSQILPALDRASTSQLEPQTHADSGVIMWVTSPAAISDTGQSANTGYDRVEMYQKLRLYNLSRITERISLECRYIPLSNMKFERARRRTFTNSSFSVSTSDALAALGFYLYSNAIVCAICEVSIKSDTEFTSLKDLQSAHHNLRRLCDLEGNIPDMFSDAWLTSSLADSKHTDDDYTSLAELGVNTSPSKYKEMAVEDRRLDSYLTHPRPSELDVSECAKAGLFYEGKHDASEDALLCFHCGAVMHTWRVNEDPWIRHARTSPTCQYLILHKGQDYIDSMLEQHGTYQPPTRENRINNVTTRMLRPRMDAPVIQTALYDLRLNRDQVKEEISTRIKSSERDFTNLTDLVRAISQSNQARQPLDFSNATPILPMYETISDNRSGASAPSIATPGAASTSSPGSASISRAASMVSLHREDSEETGAPGEAINPAEATTQLTCKVCLNNLVGIIFLPCGHLVCCTECAPAMSQCPICRNEVKGTIRAHING